MLYRIKIEHISIKLYILSGDNGTNRDGHQPDVVLQSVRRSSPSLPSLSHPSPSPSPLSAPSLSPGMCIDELSAMLATLKE